MNDAAVLELRRLAAAVESQADELAELRRCLLAKADRRRGALLVPALARLFGGEPFNVALAAARAVSDDTPPAGVVRAAINDYTDADAGLRGFGRLMVRLHGTRFGRLRLMPVPGDRWRVDGFPAE